MRGESGGRAALCVLCASMLAVVAAGCGSSASATRKVVKWYVFQEPSGAFTAAAANCSKGKPYSVQVVPLPTSADAQRELVLRRLAAKDPDIDVIGMDVTWTGEFAQAGWIRPVPTSLAPQVSAGVLPGPLATATYQKRLWAVPFTSNTQLLWYRKDLVKAPPTTWAQMIAEAKQLHTKVEIQGAKYEGLTVWFNSMIQSAGGQIVTAANKPALGKPAEIAAATMKSLAASSAADPSLSNQREDDNRLAFEKGTGVFEINYPFIYPSAKMLAPKLFPNIAWTTYPRVVANKPARPPIGGINLGVSAYSGNPARSFAVAQCLAGAQNQVIAAQKGGLPPTQSTLYDNPTLKQTYPFAALLKTSIANGAPRPVTPAYDDVALAVESALSPPASIDPAKLPSSLAAKLKKAVKGQIF
jgi:multiple sugar transport system substrate-binding protein